MTLQHLGRKVLLNKKPTAFFASRTVQKARLMVCYDRVTSLNSENDKFLAKHYGFTNEVHDFIINYDIKYHMGDELNEK